MHITDIVSEQVEDARENLLRAYDCWRRWHNPMSRRWLRECIMEYRLAIIIADQYFIWYNGQTTYGVLLT